MLPIGREENEASEDEEQAKGNNETDDTGPSFSKVSDKLERIYVNFSILNLNLMRV